MSAVLLVRLFDLVSDRFDELIDPYSCLTEDGAQGASVQFPMIWDDDLGEWIVAPQDHVAALLPSQPKAKVRENASAFAPGDGG
jgi:hypothetical protein